MASMNLRIKHYIQIIRIEYTFIKDIYFFCTVSNPVL